MNKHYEILKPLIVEEMQNFFERHPPENFWRGTTSQLGRLLQTNPHNDGRSNTITALGDVLTDLATEGLVQLTLSGDTPLWSFVRPTFQPQTPSDPAFKEISAGRMSERELLAIMSATLFDNYSGPNTPAKVVVIAKQILHEIDNTTR